MDKRRYQRPVRVAATVAVAIGLATSVAGCGDLVGDTVSAMNRADSPRPVQHGKASERHGGAPARPTSAPSKHPSASVSPSARPPVATPAAPAPSVATPGTTVEPSTPVPESAAPTGDSTPSATSEAPTGAGAVPPSTTTATTASPQWAVHPFGPSAPANRSISSATTFESKSGRRTRELRDSAGTNVNSSKWSFALYSSAASDPIVTVRGPKSGTIKARIHMPADATTTGGSDRHLGVVQPDGHTAYEFYKMTQVSKTSWTSPYVVETDLRGTGMDGGARASGTSIFWGVIRKEELRAGSIHHTLAMAIPASALKDGEVWPAQMQDSDAGHTYSGAIPMGSLFAIPPSVDVQSLGLSQDGLALARALQRYGAYVMLQSSSNALYAEYGASQTHVDRLKTAWRKLRPMLRAVTNNVAPTAKAVPAQ